LSYQKFASIKFNSDPFSGYHVFKSAVRCEYVIRAILEYFVVKEPTKRSFLIQWHLLSEREHHLQ